MAYRFLLEVPRTMVGDANAAIGMAGNAQVLVARASHGLGIDDEYQDLSIAALDLRVIPILYDWYRDIEADRPESRTAVTIVLHDGRRFGLQNADPDQTIAAIRRDQPWVERSIPKIGEHERDRFVPGRAPAATTAAAPAVSTTAVAVPVGDTDPASRIAAVGVGRSEGTLRDEGAYRLVRVMDLAKPERFYHDILGMELVRRAMLAPDGTVTPIDDDYDHYTAAQTNSEADLAFLAHGPLKIVLQRAGRATVMPYEMIVNEFALQVEPALAREIKAQVLMRGYTLLEDEGNSFTFRDPFGVAWEIAPAAA